MQQLLLLPPLLLLLSLLTILILSYTFCIEICTHIFYKLSRKDAASFLFCMHKTRLPTTFEVLQKHTTTRNVGQCPTWWPPAKYSWRPLFNTAKFGWRPILECRAVMLPKRKTCLLARVTQTNEMISAASKPKFTILWAHVEEILLLNKFFPIVDTCLNCEDIARQASFCVLYFQQATSITLQTCILNSH